ncbi:MAG: hypothetical protein HYS12_16405 [Planctomycetes bacterium]|nr:hypothetical protein [Planctomycetota bacterium]
MKKRIGGLLLLAALSGCVSSQPGSFMCNVGPGGAPPCGQGGCYNSAYVPRPTPGVMGAMGEPVPMREELRPGAGASAAEAAARATFAQSLPPDLVAQIAYQEDGPRGGSILQAGLPPGGAGVPPFSALPGPVPPVGSGAAGAVAAVGALPGVPVPFPVQRTSVRFTGPNGMQVSWFAPSTDGKAGFAPTAVTVPGRYNFPQAAIYRLKLTDIPGWQGPPLYPTLEVVPANARTATFLAHSSVPLTFTADDFEQVRAGNYVVKVIYLPYPQFQDLAVAVPGEVVLSQLEPGADPIAEALKRGSILLVVRLGNIDLEAPGTPAMDAPSPYQKVPPPGYLPGAATMGPPGMMPPPGMYPGMGNQGPMVPYGMANGGRQPDLSGIPLPPGVTPPVPPAVPGSPTSVPGPAAPPPAGPPLPSGAAGKVSDIQPVAFRAPTPDETPAKKSGWWSLFSKKSSSSDSR